MARLSHRISSRFVQDNDKTPLKFVIATLPLAIVLIYFIVEAYQRPSKPFYNLPSYLTDDAVIQKAADESGSLVPLMDMVYTVLSFCVFWAIMTAYFLGFLGARHALIDSYLDKGQSTQGNVVYESKCWAFEFRYYGYCAYTHPDPAEAKNGTLIRKRVRIFEPYTRELVPVLTLPGFPLSGQGKEDVEYASLVSLKDRPREIFQGRFCLLWTIVCALVPIYILKQMAVIDEAEYYAGITDDYDNVDKGWVVYGLFMGIGVLLVAFGGTALCWLYRRYTILHRASVSQGDLSMHGVELAGSGVSASESQQSGEEYQRMRYP